MLKQELNRIKSLLKDFGLMAIAKERSEKIVEFAELPTTDYWQARRRVMSLYNEVYL